MAIEMVKSVPEAYQGNEAEKAPKKIVEMNPKEVQVNADSVNVNQKKEVEQRNEPIKRAVEEINKNAKHSEAIFGIHEATNRVTIKIVDKETKNVIKEYPPEKTLDMIAKAWELAGVMVDERG